MTTKHKTSGHLFPNQGDWCPEVFLAVVPPSQSTNSGIRRWASNVRNEKGALGIQGLPASFNSPLRLQQLDLHKAEETDPQQLRRPLQPAGVSLRHLDRDLDRLRLGGGLGFGGGGRGGGLVSGRRVLHAVLGYHGTRTGQQQCPLREKTVRTNSMCLVEIVTPSKPGS